jgi:hypothetical protein
VNTRSKCQCDTEGGINVTFGWGMREKLVQCDTEGGIGNFRVGYERETSLNENGF